MAEEFAGKLFFGFFPPPLPHFYKARPLFCSCVGVGRVGESQTGAYGGAMTTTRPDRLNSYSLKVKPQESFLAWGGGEENNHKDPMQMSSNHF